MVKSDVVSRDQVILSALKSLRLAGYGITTIGLVKFLTGTGLSDERIGLFMTLTLVGDTVLSLLVSQIADRLGRKQLLCLSLLIMAMSGAVFATTTNYYALLMAAVLGVISPSGDEVGPFRALEEAAMLYSTSSRLMPIVTGVSSLLGTFSMGGGMLLGGFIESRLGGSMKGYKLIFWIYFAIAMTCFLLCLFLTQNIEAHQEMSQAHQARPTQETDPLLAPSPVNGATGGRRRRRSSAVTDLFEAEAAAVEAEAEAFFPPGPQSSSSPRGQTEQAELSGQAEVGAAEAESGVGGHRVMSRGQIGLLLTFFAVDSLAYGFMTNSWIVEYFRRTFGSSPEHIAEFMFVANMLSAFSALPSIVLMRLLGPLRTVIFTKLGAGLAGGMMPLATTSKAAMATLFVRSMFDVMDVVPRTIFLTKLIPKEQYFKVTSYLYIAKTQGRSLGPLFTGYFAARGMLDVCFYLLGGLEWLFAIMIHSVYGTQVS